MKKKILSIALALTLALSLSACGGGGEEKETKNTEVQQESSTEESKDEEVKEKKQEEAKEVKESEVVVKGDELPFGVMTIEPEPGSDGDEKGTYIYQNTSKYPIKDFEIVVRFKDTNETKHFKSDETIQPDVTSGNFGSFIVNSSVDDNIEYLEEHYTVIKDDANYQISYDFNSNQYKQLKLEK